MNDMQKTENDIVDLDSVNDVGGEAVENIDLDKLYDEVELDALDDGDDNVVPVAVSSGKSSSEKLWLVLTAIFFLLAVVSSFLFPPAISVQTQRVDQVAEIIDKVNLTNISATQALSATGSFSGVKNNLNDAQQSVNKIVAAPSGLAGLSNILFDNKEANDSILNVWNSYKKATDDFIKTEENVSDVKRLALELDTSISTAISDSVGFVEAVAKEGRNKSGSTSKDKYLFLTSEASNLNGILGRLSSSMRGYFNADSNLQQLSSRQNGLMVRLQDTLNRIVSNSAAVVGTAAEPLQQRYSGLEAQVSGLGERASAMTDARKALTNLRQKSSELSTVVNSASNQTSFVNLVSRLSSMLPIIFGLLGVIALWRYSNAQTKELVEHDADLEETLADQQESILKLLDEMSALAGRRLDGRSRGNRPNYRCDC